MTGVIDHAMKLTTPEELNKVNDSWRQTYLSILITNKISKPEDFDAISAEGSVTTTKAITISPSGSRKIKGMTRIYGHTKHIHVITEPSEVNLWVVLSPPVLILRSNLVHVKLEFTFRICVPEKPRFKHIL